MLDFYGVKMRGLKESPKVLRDRFRRIVNRRDVLLRFNPAGGDGV